MLPLAAALQLSALRSAPRRAAVSPQMGLLDGLKTPQTVGEAKDAFQKAYGRPVGTIEQVFVQEILSLSQMAIVASNYEYSRVWSAGFQGLCEIFLSGCKTDGDREAIRSSMCIGLGMDPSKVKRDAEEVIAQVSDGMTEEQLFELSDLKKIAAKGNFKYTYVLGTGLVKMMQAVNVEPGEASIDRWCEKLNLRPNAFKRDWTYYQSAVGKLDAAKEMMLQMQVSAKRQEAARLAKKAEAAAKEAEDAEAAETAA